MRLGQTFNGDGWIFSEDFLQQSGLHVLTTVKILKIWTPEKLIIIKF